MAAHRPRVENPYGAVNPPIVRSSTFSYPTAEEGARRFAVAGGDTTKGASGLFYSRMENPTVAALESHLAHLEGAEACVATASGMAAIHCTLMGLLKPRGRVVADACVYGCTHTLLSKLRAWGVRVDLVDTTDPEALETAVRRGVDVVFIETPMNPTLRVVDLRHAADITHDAGGHLVVDNTFCTPVAQKPLALGADLVVHSLTKGINGHSDLLGGCVAGPSGLVARAWEWRKDAGAVMDPETAWLALRGSHTLELRVRQASDSALELAKTLQAEGITVSHPLLKGHPDHKAAKAQMSGCSVLTVDLDSAKAAMAFLDRLRLFTRAVSLGGYESLACHPASTTHASLGPAGQKAAGITPGLVRLAVGVEPYEAIVEDVLGALHRRPVAKVDLKAQAKASGKVVARR
jgi:methionine-gamma-lyase